MLSLADYFCLRMKNVNLVIIKRISQYLFSLSGFFSIILVNWPPALTYPERTQFSTVYRVQVKALLLTNTLIVFVCLKMFDLWLNQSGG